MHAIQPFWLQLQLHSPSKKAILSASIAGADDTKVFNINIMWSCLANMIEPSDLSKHIRRAWDTPVITATYNIMMYTSQSLVDTARLIAVVTPHAGDWLHASPLTAMGLWLSDKAIRVSIGCQLGTIICRLHTNAYVALRLMPEV